MQLCSTSADCAGEFPVSQHLFDNIERPANGLNTWLFKKGCLDNQHNNRKPEKAFVVSNTILDAIQFILNLRMILSMRIKTWVVFLGSEGILNCLHDESLIESYYQDISTLRLTQTTSVFHVDQQASVSTFHRASPADSQRWTEWTESISFRESIVGIARRKWSTF